MQFKQEGGSVMSLEKLLEVGYLQWAQQPADNQPEYLQAPRLTVTLIGEDYPGKTPSLWNKVFRQFGFDDRAVMLVVKPENLGGAVEAMRADPRYPGGGIGVGLKKEISRYLDELEPLATLSQAVNVVVKAEDRLKGYNTDGPGFTTALAEFFQSRGESLGEKKIIVLGAGGTGNAIVFSLAQQGARLTILNRTVERAKQLAQEVNAYFGLTGTSVVQAGGEDQVVSVVATADVVVNVSLKGAQGELQDYSALAEVELPATAATIQKNLERAEQILSTIPTSAIIADIVLRDGKTPLIASAVARGLTVLDGVPMVVNQGIEAFWLVNGARLKDSDITKEDVARLFKQRQTAASS